MYGLSFLKGLGIGASALYLLDPIAGRRRRTLIQNQFISLGHDIQRFIDRGTRDLTNRCTGMVAEARACCSHEDATSEQIVQRVRSTMGRFVSHPKAIDVRAEDGRVILNGTILSHEVIPFLAAVKSVRGVQDIANQLEVQESHEAPEMHSEHRSKMEKTALRFASTPSGQLVAAAIGTTLAASLLTRRRPSTVLLALVGCGWLMKSYARSAQLNSSHAGDGSSNEEYLAWDSVISPS